MSTPPNTPPPPNSGNNGPFPPGDPRNQQYGNPPYAPDPRVLREQERARAEAQRDQVRAERHQAKAWNQYQREASRQQVRAARQQARMAAEAQRAQLRAWRRSTRSQSIIGPLLLIAVAVAALLVYNGRIPFFTLLTFFGRWWPLVLIAAGVLRLVEWAIARHQSEARGVPVRFAIGGGTVWLLILISVAGLAAQGGIHRNGDNWTLGWTGQDFNQFFGSKHEEDAAAITHSIAATGTLEIHNDHGDVTVEGTSDDGLVHLSEHKEVFANDDSRANNLMSDLNPQFSGSDSELVLRIAGSDSSTATLSLTVPRGVHVVLNSNHGDVAVHSMHAAVAVNANRGDVDCSAVVGDVAVRTNSRHGSVQIHSVQGAVALAGSGDGVNFNDIDGPVAVNGDFFGDGHLQHIAGAVNYNAGRISFTAQRIDGEVSFDSDDEFNASNVAGPITVRTRSRNITLDRVSGDMQVTNSSGHVDITAVTPTGAIAVDNRDGDVTLSLPNSAHFTLAAETSDGSIQSDFPGVGGNTNASHHGTLNTTVGSGGPAIRLTTTHGNIQLDRNSKPPVAPMAPIAPIAPILSNLPPEARDGMREAQQAMAEGKREAQEAIAESKREAAQARREGEQAAAEGKREAEQARQEAKREAEQARREGDQARQEALREAEQSRREAQRDAEQSRREAEQQRREAQQRAREARGNAQHSSGNATPNPPATPQ